MVDEKKYIQKNVLFQFSIILDSDIFIARSNTEAYYVMAMSICFFSSDFAKKKLVMFWF